MNSPTPAPFQFHTCFNFVELTGRKATTLEELAKGIETVPGSSIFYHTHHYLMKYHYSTKLYGNDFSHWVMDALQEDALAERLANIDIREFQQIRSLRETILSVIYQQLSSGGEQRAAPKGEAFHFCNAITFTMPTGLTARDLSEFCEGLEQVGTASLFYHFFEARLRLEQNVDDFSLWIEASLGEPGLAAQLRNLDPYRYRLEVFKGKMIELIRHHLRKKEGGLPRPVERLFKWLRLS